jgi:signal transduction histidine kinase/ActR/RegA family two-component response regulator
VTRFGLTLRLLLLLAASILPAMAALLYVQIGLRHERSERVADGALHQAQLLSADVETLIDGARQLSLTVAMLHSVQGPAGGCAVELRILRASLPSYALLEVVDDGGHVICASGADGGPALWTQILAALQSGRLSIGRYTPAPGARAMLPVIQPFMAGQRRGVVVAGIDLGWMQQRIQRFRTSPVNSVTVADAGGTILLRLPDPGRWTGHQVAAGARDLVNAPAPGIRALTGIDGVPRMVGYVPATQAAGVYVAYGVYVPEVLATIDRTAQRGYVLIAVCAIVTLLLMMLITRRLIHMPTEALLNAAQRWSQGDLAARATLKVPEGSEFGRLAAAFNFMAEALDVRRRQLQHLNTSLEARVVERTQALSETNNRLQVEINERARTDAALRRSQQLQAVGHLAGGMAHEFNNLLTTILGALELLRIRLGDHHPQQRYITAGVEAAQHGARLTSQLLAFARRRRLMPIAVDLNAVIEDMLALLQGTVGRAITLRLELAAAPWPALADRYEIEAAILNLVLNARDAMAQGGTLRLTTRNAVLPRPGSHADPSGEFVELMIQDDGAGMSEAELAHAVDPFFTTKGPGQGAGLGLSQVHGVAQQLGGDLHIESAQGHGTTVSLFLPRATMQVHDRSQEPACATRPQLSQPVLLVDDDDQVRQVATDMLTELGYDVTAAADAPSALHLLRLRADYRPFAAMVVDYYMPGMTGLELIAQALTLQPGLITLLITGYMDVAEMADGELLRPRQVLRKPFTLRELAARIDELSNAQAAETV